MQDLTFFHKSEALGMVYLIFSKLWGNHGICVVMATYVIFITEFFWNW